MFSDCFQRSHTNIRALVQLFKADLLSGGVCLRDGKEDHYSLFCIGKSFELLYFLLKSLPTHLRTKEETEIISKRNARIKRLIQYVDENYMHKIRLADFAEREGCSLSYLSRFIKCTMNQSFQEYVTSVRFHCACKLIVSGEKKMLDVCIPGDGDVDFDPVFRVLADAGYQGWLLVEAEQDPAKANPLEYAMKARKYIREHTGL